MILTRIWTALKKLKKSFRNKLFFKFVLGAPVQIRQVILWKQNKNILNYGFIRI